MGTGSGMMGKPKSPHEVLNRQKRKEARTRRCIEGQESEFYRRCASGDIDGVREILEKPDRPHIDELVKVESNGDTPLHVATRTGNKAIVKLLMENRCPRHLLDREGKYAYEYAEEPFLRNSFNRNAESSRFYDTDLTGKVSCYVPESKAQNIESSNVVSDTNNTNTLQSDSTNRAKKWEFVQPFENEEETYKYALDQQTMAMWIRFYSWLSRTFPSRFQHDFLRTDTFDLDKNQDFKDFLKKRCKPHEADNTLEAINKAKTDGKLEHIIRMYTCEDACYRKLNEQLSSSTEEHESAPHLCDRFIMEFYIHSDQLERLRFKGKTHRGATIDSNALCIYERALENKPDGVLAFKSFTSTSVEKDVALGFMKPESLKEGKLNVLFIITVNETSTNIFSVRDFSAFPQEEEILIMPGTLFVVTNINPAVEHVLKTKETEKTIICTEIHLKYRHIPMSFWKKLRHTYKSANSEAFNQD